MADITNKNLEQLLSADDAERREAEDQVMEAILDDLNTPTNRDSILNLLRTTPDPRNLAKINFADQFKSIQEAINNLSVDSTDPAEVERLNNQRKELRKRVNMITRRALVERISDLDANIAGLGLREIDQNNLRINLRRKVLTTLFQETIESNNGNPLTNEQIMDVLLSFYMNNEVFPATTTNRNPLYWDTIGFSGAMPRAINRRTLLTQLNAENRPGSTSTIKKLSDESYRQYIAWGGIDSREQIDINQAKPLMEELKNRLSSDVMFYDSDAFLTMLLNDDPIVAPFNTPEISGLITQIRRLLGPVGTGASAGHQRTQRLARMYNLKITHNPGTHDYDHAITRQTVLDRLISWQEGPSAEIQTSLQDRLSIILEDSTDDFAVNPPALNRLLSTYIAEIKENPLYGADGNERMKNAYQHFYLKLTLQRPVAARLPIAENDLRVVVESFLTQAPSTIDAHNTRVNRTSTLVRGPLYTEINIQANGLAVPLVDRDVEMASETVLTNLINLPPNNITLEEVGAALYLPVGRRYQTEIVRDIANKMRALRTSVRFAENPNVRLSDTEINTMIIPFMPNCEKIIEELMRIATIPAATNSFDYRLQLEEILKNPATQPNIYLKFKEIAGKFGNITDISMLQDIAMHKALRRDGYTLNLSQVLTAGFRPNTNLKSFIQSNALPFAESMNGYNQTFEYLRERLNVLHSIPEATRTDEQKEELDLLTELNANPQSYNDLIRDLSENYRNVASRPDTDRAKRLYKSLQKKYNSVNGTATPVFQGLFPGASSLEENLAHCYKTLTALNTVFVPRVEENTLVPEIDPATGRPKLDARGNPIMINPVEAEKRPVETARADYAKKRRNLQKFTWFSRPRKDDLDDSRADYVVASRDYTLRQIENEFPDSDFTGTPEKINQRKIDRKNRILELINGERRALFDEELRAQTEKEGFLKRGFNRFRNAWRNHKKLRLFGSAVCMGGAITGAAMGLPAAALGTFVVSGAVIRGVSSYMGWTAGWEALRNRFGKTKRLDRAKLRAMTPDQIRETMAAQTTLALSEKGDPLTTGSFTPATRPVGNLVRPASTRDFDKAEASGVNAMFSSEYQEQQNPTPDSDYYRQKTSRELWNFNNERTRNLIDAEFAAGKTTVQVLDTLYIEESKLMKSIEEREVAIRKNNVLKHATGLALGTFMSVGIPGLFALKDWLFPGDTPPVTPEPLPVDPDPVPVPPPVPVPVPPPVPVLTTADLIIPDRVFDPFVGNADKLISPGLTVDETPGIWQSIANKLDMTYGSGVIDSNPEIKASLLADNPQMNGVLGGVHTGDKINISSNTAELLAKALNESPRYPNDFTADKVLMELKKPWPSANM